MSRPPTAGGSGKDVPRYMQKTSTWGKKNKSAELAETQRIKEEFDEKLRQKVEEDKQRRASRPSTGANARQAPGYARRDSSTTRKKLSATPPPSDPTPGRYQHGQAKLGISPAIEGVKRVVVDDEHFSSDDEGHLERELSSTAPGLVSGTRRQMTTGFEESSLAQTTGSVRRTMSHAHVHQVQELRRQRSLTSGDLDGSGRRQHGSGVAGGSSQLRGSGSFRRSRSDGATLRHPAHGTTPVAGPPGSSMSRRPPRPFAGSNSHTPSGSNTPVSRSLEASQTFGSSSNNDRIALRAEIELEEWERKRQLVEARQQHDPTTVLKKRWLEAIAATLAMRHFVVNGFGMLSELHREAAARNTLMRLFVPMWTRFRAIKYDRAEKVLQHFIMRVAIRKRQRRRHQAAGIIGHFLRHKLMFLSHVIRWHVDKVRRAQGMMRLMMKRRDAQVELNLRMVRDVEEKLYWEAAGRQISVADSIRRASRGEKAYAGVRPIDPDTETPLTLPEPILRRQIRQRITNRSRDYHREVIRRNSSLRSAMQGFKITSFRRESLTAARLAGINVHASPNPKNSQRSPPVSLNNTLRSTNTQTRLSNNPPRRLASRLSPSSAFAINIDDGQPAGSVARGHQRMASSGSVVEVGDVGSPRVSTPIAEVDAFYQWRLQHAARHPVYSAFLPLEDLFAILDDSCFDAGAVQQDPAWTRHLSTGSRTSVPEACRSSFRIARQARQQRVHTRAEDVREALNDFAFGQLVSDE